MFGNGPRPGPCASSCGVHDVDTRLRQAADDVARGRQSLYGLRMEGRVVAAMAVQAGELWSLPQDASDDARSTGTLHIEVLAVDKRAQRQGHGARLLHAAIVAADTARQIAGLCAVSVEVAELCVPFYLHHGFQTSEQVPPGVAWLAL